MKKLLNIRQAAEYLNVTPHTLRVWEKEGRLKSLKTAGSHRRYTPEMLDDFLGIDSSLEESILDETEQVVATYARVSSNKQKVSGDLERQSERLSEYCTKHKFNLKYEIKDVGSGLNDNRNGFKRLTDLILDNKINILVIENKDRLTRFQFNFIEKVFNHYNCKIVVINSQETISDAEELTIDMMSLLASFSGKFYSRRSSKNKQKQK